MKLISCYLNWNISPATSAAAIIFVLAAGVTVWQPAFWPWTIGVVAVNHLFLTAAGLWPRSRLLGSNWVRLPAASEARREIALTIDDGPDPHVTPQVLDILDRYQAKATFFCIAARASQHADLCREIVRRGHSIENHTQRHSPLFSFYGPFGTRREIQSAQHTLSAITGQAPRFFRPPAGLRSPLLHPVLAHLGLQHASWSRRGFDTRQRDPCKVLKELVRGLRGGDILLLHDGNAAITPAGNPVILEVLPRLLEQIAAEGLRTVTLRSALA